KRSKIRATDYAETPSGCTSPRTAGQVRLSDRQSVWESRLRIADFCPLSPVLFPITVPRLWLGVDHASAFYPRALCILSLFVDLLSCPAEPRSCGTARLRFSAAFNSASWAAAGRTRQTDQGLSRRQHARLASNRKSEVRMRARIRQLVQP